MNNGKKLFYSLEISKNIVSERLRIGQNDLQTSLLLDNFSCDLKRVEMTLPILLGAKDMKKSLK